MLLRNAESVVNQTEPNLVKLKSGDACYPRNSEPRGSHESGIHCTWNTKRDWEIDWGSASARTEGEEDDTGTAQNISSRQEKNRSRTTGKVGENQGIKEIEKSPDPV